MASKKKHKIEHDDTQHKAEFKPLNEAQAKAWETISNNLITFLLGPAGTAKTHTATAWAMIAAYSGRYNKAVFTRPIVEACESLGWLPGSVDEKIAPYMTPLNTCANKVGKSEIIIETAPIAYLRGVTFEHCVAILDEAQNCTRSQLKLYLTRFGTGCKMIICGDHSQADIKSSGLYKTANDLSGIDGIGIFHFTTADTVRHPIVEKIIQRLEVTDTKD